MANNVEKLKSAPFGQKLFLKLTTSYKELPIIVANSNIAENENKISKNKMKRIAMNKMQQGSVIGNPSININNQNANCFMQNRNINSDNMIKYNYMNHMGNNNLLGNVQNMYPVINGNNNNYQPLPYNISNFNINSNNNNNFALNYNTNQMQPMAVNQYVNQVFYNYGYNHNNNNNNMIPSQSVQQVQQSQAQKNPAKYNFFGQK